ncbi:hypothetical protein Taro_030036 [Colocasia esculenta]|uniref:Uncharacterized protein n=1 Tax=Colocasia esculenta TaxID=4460 RepID=A0A843VLE3_COLES|nr:hypothetical protein [Colocasia esculenta]
MIPRVQPTRRLRTCAKAKNTYGGLDKESLVLSGVFPTKRWSKPKECVETRVRRASSARRPRATITVFKSCN